MPLYKGSEKICPVWTKPEGDMVSVEMLGCESVEEANYLEDIMPELLTMKYKGELLWA